MISPNQIKMQTFTSAGRGAYRAADVDAFMQEVYVSYTELLSENASMKKKFASLSSIIDEYNAGKNAIATALVKAQAVADETMRTAKEDASGIVSDAKEEANHILNESQQQAEQYAREKKEAADAYFTRAETELQRVIGEAKTQSDAFVQEVNAQAAALIADANEKAAAIVGAAYKDAKVAKEKTEEIIERANVEIETTRNEISSFKEAALQMLSNLLPLVEGIDPNNYTAPDLSASTEIPVLAAKEETAPDFSLNGVFSDDDLSAVEQAQDAQPIPDTEVSAPVELPELSKQDDLIAQISSIINENQPDDNAQPSLFETYAEPQMPAYHPYEPAEAAEPETEEIVDADDESFADYDEIEDDDEEAELSADDEATAVLESEEAEAFTDDEDDEDDDEDDEDVPLEPFKFRLTKNFDIFDEDND